MFWGTRSLPPYQVFRFNKKTRSVIKRIDILMQSLVLLDPEWFILFQKDFYIYHFDSFQVQMKQKFIFPKIDHLKKII